MTETIINFSDFNADFDKTNRSDLALFKNINSIKESVKNIILAKKGSTLMDPEFGSGVYDYLFNMLDSISTDNLKDVIKIDLLNYEPRITVNSISITQDNPNSLFITIIYTITSLNVDDTVYITIEEST